MLPPVPTAFVPAAALPPPYVGAAPRRPHAYPYPNPTRPLHPQRCLPCPGAYSSPYAAQYAVPYLVAPVAAPPALPALRTLPPPFLSLPALKEAARSPTGGCSPSSSASTPTSHKGALAFILSADADEDACGPPRLVPPSAAVGRKRPAPCAAADAPGKKKSRKGSKFCAVEGCASRAKHARRCWKHGGSVKCKVADCANRAKSKGVCWSHGGGTVCAFSDCETISVSNGFCWAHGGGKRCSEGGCSKPAYERTRNLCSAHFREARARDKARADGAGGADAAGPF